MAMSQKRLEDFVRLVEAGDIHAYNDQAATRKDRFLREGKTILREIAKRMGLQKGSFDVSSNPGGIGVGGDVTLHGERIYVHMDAGQDSFYFRRCNGMRDYHGRVNRCMPWPALALRLDEVVESLARESSQP